LFGAPTLVNNVETLVNILPILRGGGRAFARIGTEHSTGSKLFCVSGKVERPGVYEIEMGTSLGDLLAMAGTGAGGDAGAGAPVRAVLLGGAAGSFVGPEQFDMALSFEGARAAGASLGSGVVIVLDETVDVGAIVRRLAAFFRDESCGQCVPCRVGTVRQVEALERLHVGRTLGSAETEEALLADLAQVMRDASICGLGQTAATAVQSALRLFGRAAFERTRP
jgi:NADH-quinone oxidoreductase subunit F